MNGSYYAVGTRVFREPIETKNGDGTSSFALGFCVCEIMPGLDDDAAQEIAVALNRQIEEIDATETIAPIPAAFDNVIARQRYHTTVLERLAGVLALAILERPAARIFTVTKEPDGSERLSVAVRVQIGADRAENHHVADSRPPLAASEKQPLARALPPD